jgi:hypothetical protein
LSAARSSSVVLLALLITPVLIIYPTIRLCDLTTP